MNARMPTIVTAAAEQPLDYQIPPRAPKRLELFGIIFGKLLLVAVGLAVGGFVGLIVALFSGLLVFAC